MREKCAGKGTWTRSGSAADESARRHLGLGRLLERVRFARAAGSGRTVGREALDFVPALVSAQQLVASGLAVDLNPAPLKSTRLLRQRGATVRSTIRLPGRCPGRRKRVLIYILPRDRDLEVILKKRLGKGRFLANRLIPQGFLSAWDYNSGRLPVFSLSQLYLVYLGKREFSEARNHWIPTMK